MKQYVVTRTNKSAPRLNAPHKVGSGERNIYNKIASKLGQCSCKMITKDGDAFHQGSMHQEKLLHFFRANIVVFLDKIVF